MLKCTPFCCRYLEQLPPTLFVTELLARSAVQMSKHYIVQCQLGFLTDRQLTKLQVPTLPNASPVHPLDRHPAGAAPCGSSTADSTLSYHISYQGCCCMAGVMMPA